MAGDYYQIMVFQVSIIMAVLVFLLYVYLQWKLKKMERFCHYATGTECVLLGM